MTDFSLTQINEKISDSSRFIDDLISSMNKVIIGQEKLIDKIIISMLANGHILLEGVPGLAKTMMVKELSNLLIRFSTYSIYLDMLPRRIKY